MKPCLCGQKYGHFFDEHSANCPANNPNEYIGPIDHPQPYSALPSMIYERLTEKSWYGPGEHHHYQIEHEHGDTPRHVHVFVQSPELEQVTRIRAMTVGALVDLLEIKK